VTFAVKSSADLSEFLSAPRRILEDVAREAQGVPQGIFLFHFIFSFPFFFVQRKAYRKAATFSKVLPSDFRDT
jgi:hypothetical protein